MYTLTDAARLIGKTPAALRGLIHRNNLDACEVTVHNRKIWMISDQALASLGKEVIDGDYTELRNEWFKSLRAGIRVKRPYSDKSMERVEYGLQLLWRMSGLEPSLDQLTVDTLERALTNIPVEHEARNCHYTMRMSVFNSFCGFAGFLVHKKVLRPTVLDGVASLKPHRHYPPRKLVVHKAKLSKVFAANRDRKNRTSYDKILTDMIVHLMAFAGLRLSEVIRLKLEDIDFDNRLMTVSGKGGKQGNVPMLPILHDRLKKYVTEERPASGHHSLLLQRFGLPITRYVIRGRIRRLSDWSDLPFHPHALRRSCATLLADQNTPTTYIQKVLRHNQLTTTRSYIMDDERVIDKFIQGLDVGLLTDPTPEPGE